MRESQAGTAPGVVMLLDSLYPTRGGGGAEGQVRTLTRWMHERRVAVRVVVPRVSYGPPDIEDEVDGVPVYRVPYPPRPGIGAVVYLGRLALWLLRERRRYGAIHAHIGSNAAAVAAVVGRMLRVPVLVKMTGMTELSGGVLGPNAGSIGTRLRRAALRRASGFQATSTRIAAGLSASGFALSRIHVVPNAVDLARFDAPRDEALRRQWCGDAHFVGLFVGRLEPEKDPLLLLRAWAQALGDDPGCVLLLVGAGSLGSEAQALAQSLGIAGRVRFVGAEPDVERFCAIADVGLLPSRFEGLSNALLEYMAASLPVIGSRVSGTEDFIAEGRTGWLHEPGDADGLAAALRAAAELPASARVAIGEQARATVAARASLDQVGAALLRLYTAKAPAAPAGLARPAGS